MTVIITKPIGENIVKLNSVSWATFNHLLDELGNKRSQRLTYNDYQECDRSLVFPFLNLSLIPELIQQSLIDGETAVLRAFRKYVIIE